MNTNLDTKTDFADDIIREWMVSIFGVQKTGVFVDTGGKNRDK
jgi:hypothetical protein